MRFRISLIEVKLYAEACVVKPLEAMLKMIAWQVRVKNIMKTDALGRSTITAWSHHRLHLCVFPRFSSAVFWRVDGLAAFPQPVQENP
ncbi:hypothetical protein TNIN_479281 [Trichonephila inaurata madagascariensis]|uniref:Uncharacterized protein n=1 Tax=Trichonephila inaurata madagascariensis TaxID=2747483 RepID=A0A8X7C958_9ARAC|nr:hypothetical protein TNIN_479281 [Trichonephila inaurata madagascariensis]